MASISATETVLSDARNHKQELLNQLFGVSAVALAAGAPEPGLLDSIPRGSNVVGVGYGAKVTDGANLDADLAVRVYVRTKLPQSAVATSEIVPPTVNGLPTDVISVGDIVALARPTPCGISVGHFRITAGTLGCLVKMRDPAQPGLFVLSNNHVLADSNSGAIGDNILEPGPLDGGTVPIAHLTDFKALDFSGATNDIDAAIAKLISDADVTPDIKILGRIQPTPSPAPMLASLYQSVRKHGRTTLHTVGVIMDVAASIRVGYGTNIAQFDDQLAITGAGGNFSAGGDSGSLIVDAVTRQPVGLLFAGGGSLTFANPIGLVLDHFGADIV